MSGYPLRCRPPPRDTRGPEDHAGPGQSRISHASGVDEWVRLGEGATLVPADVDQCAVSRSLTRTAAPSKTPALRSCSACCACDMGYTWVVARTWYRTASARNSRPSARVFEVTLRSSFS